MAKVDIVVSFTPDDYRLVLKALSCLISDFPEITFEQQRLELQRLQRLYNEL